MRPYRHTSAHKEAVTGSGELTFARVVIGVMILLAGCVQGMDLELTVKKGQAVCFEDFLSNENIVTYGFSPFQVSSIEDLMDKKDLEKSTSDSASSTNAGESQTSSASASGKNNRRVLQGRRGGRGRTPYNGRYSSYGDPYSDRMRSRSSSRSRGPYGDEYPYSSGRKKQNTQGYEDPEYYGDEEDDDYDDPYTRAGKKSRDQAPPKKKGKAVSQELTPEEIKEFKEEIGTPMEEAPKVANKKDKVKKNTEKYVGILVIKNKSGTVMSPKVVKPFTLYKLSIEDTIDVLDICYTNTAEADTLIRLFYTVHRRTPPETQMPTKDESDQLLAKIKKVEQTFLNHLYSYHQLQVFEQRFASTSNSVLSNFMMFGQILLAAYMLVVWLLRLTVEKTFKYKKII